MFRRERIITQNIGTGLTYRFKIYIETYETYWAGDEDPTAYTKITISSDPNITVTNTNILDQIKPVTITFDYNGPGYFGYSTTQFSKDLTVTANLDYPGEEYILETVTLREYNNVMYVKDNDDIRNYLNIYLNPLEDSVFKYAYTLNYDYNYDEYNGSGGGDSDSGSGDNDDSKPTNHISVSPGWGQATTLLLITADAPVYSNITITVEESDDDTFDEFSTIKTDYHTLYAGSAETEISPMTYEYVRFVGISPTSDDKYEYAVWAE